MLAGLIGPTLVAGGASMLLNLGSLPALIGQASGDAALILTTGAHLRCRACDRARAQSLERRLAGDCDGPRLALCPRRLVANTVPDPTRLGRGRNGSGNVVLGWRSSDPACTLVGTPRATRAHLTLAGR